MVAQNTIDLFKVVLKKLQPPEDIPLSEWADKYRVLSVESSSEPGQWQTDRTPYLKKIMDAISDPNVQKVIIMSSAQVGKSEVLLNCTGYFIHIDPTRILLIQPTVEMGKDFSKERLTPMLRDTPVLRKIFGAEKSRDSKNTILKKYFPGGFVAVIGANSPVGLASRSIRVIVADEIDRWPESAGVEGDPLTLAEKRTITYEDTAKLVYVSTPTIDGISRIQNEYLSGSMEIWKLPCPSCGEYHELKWADIIFKTTEDTGELDESVEIMAACPSCGEINNEYAWKSGDGKWVAQRESREIKSFTLSALVSPWRKWEKIVRAFLIAKDDIEMHKAWTNTELGEPWVADGETVDEEMLYNRRIPYGNTMVPKDVLVLTAGVDVQDDRFEMEVVGWGENKQSWGIEYKVIHGDTSLPETWDRLDDQLKTVYRCEDGADIEIMRVYIDSGGHRTTECYKFCKPREHRGVYAIKGRGGQGLHIVHTVSKTKKEKNCLFIIGTDMAKARMFAWLSLTERHKSGYCNFPYYPYEEIRPTDDIDDIERGYDQRYFAGLTSEIKTVKMVKGRPKTEWILKAGAKMNPWTAGCIILRRLRY